MNVGTRLTRSQPGQPPQSAAGADLQRGDQITARLGPDGIAEQVSATYEQREGIVQEFGQLTPYAMPFVSLQGNEGRHVLDLSAPLHTPAHPNAVIKGLPLGTVDIAAGDRVRLRLNPVSGRIFELWKA